VAVQKHLVLKVLVKIRDVIEARWVVDGESGASDNVAEACSIPESSCQVKPAVREADTGETKSILSTGVSDGELDGNDVGLCADVIHGADVNTFRGH
jgi:hypothetical protein